MRLRYIVFAVVIAVLIWCAYGDLSVRLAAYFTENRETDLGNAGAWGDSFGAFNALVSMIGAGAVVVRLIVQLGAIRAQQHDLHRQRFESSFFELLCLLRELRSEMRFQHSADYKKVYDHESNETEHEGYAAVRHALREMTHWHREAAKALNRADIGRLYDRRVSYLNEHSMSPYFRLIYTIMKKIRQDLILEEKEKYEYGNLLRSQLTGMELYLLAYNACSNMSKDLTDHIEHFRLFKYMGSSAAKARFSEIFKPVAFEARS